MLFFAYLTIAFVDMNPVSLHTIFIYKMRAIAMLLLQRPPFCIQWLITAVAAAA
jgi:hypothetical protein